MTEMHTKQNKTLKDWIGSRGQKPPGRFRSRVKNLDPVPSVARISCPCLTDLTSSQQTRKIADTLACDIKVAVSIGTIIIVVINRVWNGLESHP